jgi:hypothetical protein
VCNYLCENAKLYYLYTKVIQSTLMCYIFKFLIKKIYILLSNINSNDVVMSRVNSKLSLTPFVKSGALHVQSAHVSFEAFIRLEVSLALPSLGVLSTRCSTVDGFFAAGPIFLSSS